MGALRRAPVLRRCPRLLPRRETRWSWVGWCPPLVAQVCGRAGHGFLSLVKHLVVVLAAGEGACRGSEHSSHGLSNVRRRRCLWRDRLRSFRGDFHRGWVGGAGAMQQGGDHGEAAVVERRTSAG
jgi:hypothetical protein